MSSLCDHQNPRLICIRSVSGTFYVALFYLPIYFQTVRGASAIASGVRLIPLILGLSKMSGNTTFGCFLTSSLALTQIVVGVAITATSVFFPFMIAGPAIAAIGAGLLTTLTEQSSTGAWIGYQILLGIGSGACLTIPMMLSQVTVDEDDVAIATAAMICKLSLPTSSHVKLTQISLPSYWRSVHRCCRARHLPKSLSTVPSAARSRC